MENGTYHKKLDFDKLKVNKFVPHLYSTADCGIYGCGASLLSTITGIHPSKIYELNKRSAHWQNNFIISFLRERNYQLTELTKANLSNKNVLNGLVIDAGLDNSHIIISLQLLAKGEASWLIYYNGFCYHNFVISRLHGYDFLNMPLLKAWVLWHRKYK